MSKKHINFAYGSNMSTSRLFARLPNAELLGVGTLHAYQLTFDMLSTDGSAKCNIVPAKQREVFVHGVLYALDDEELARLDEIEGERYDREAVEIVRPCGEILIAQSYIANTFIDTHLPFDWYVEHVLKGAQEHQFNSDYITQISAQTSQSDSNIERAAREWAIHKL